MDTQNLFAIVQGGLDARLRDLCVNEMINRKDRVAGYAIGGLSGGEEKGMPEMILSRLLWWVFERFRCPRYLLESVCDDDLVPIVYNADASRSIKQCADKLPFDRKVPSKQLLLVLIIYMLYRTTILDGRWLCRRYV